MSRAALLLVAGLLCGRAAAHDGPPYPILVDEVVGGYTLSVWADPDVGEGTFYYYVEAPPGRAFEDVRIVVTSRPVDDSAPPVEGTSELAPRSAPYQQRGTLPFAHRGRWSTRFVLRPADPAADALGALEFDLDVTPPGLGPVELSLYAIPFVVIALFWLRIFLAQRAHDRGRTVAPRP